MVDSNFKPIQLYTWSTPNGVKVHTLLEELKAAYPGFSYDAHSLDILSADEPQKKPDFLKINPNGRIPAIVDPNHDNFNVFESAAILLWLEKAYDPKHLFSWPSSDPNADKLRSEVLQWIYFVHGGVGPMQGQANHFRGQATGASKNVIPYALKRYQNETKRLYSVLEERLQGRDWLVGEGKGKYTLADINAFGWVSWHAFAGIPRSDLGPNLQRWLKNNYDRPAVQASILVPDNNQEKVKKLLDPNFVAENPKLD
ncbi:Glutathione S-transferase [Ceraceosorus bombacis]|uniref:Glutathione S-transferase n=1 Tax=Ceraceosorus bombacis TaxID=401625 RepID=A0A0N7L959_9BASI|nr:Glutathione S-transferase [Ceraceosorus bombacis]